MKKVNLKRLGKAVFRMINKSFWKEGNDKLSEKAYMRMSEMAWKTFIEVFCSAADNDKCLNEICRKTPAEGFNSKEYSGYIADMIYEHVRKYIPADNDTENESSDGTADNILCPPEMTVVEDIDGFDIDDDFIGKICEADSEDMDIEKIIRIVNVTFEIFSRVFEYAFLAGCSDSVTADMFDTDKAAERAVNAMLEFLDDHLSKIFTEDDNAEKSKSDTCENETNEAEVSYPALIKFIYFPQKNKYFDDFYNNLRILIGDKKEFIATLSSQMFKDGMVGCYMSYTRGANSSFNRCVVERLVEQINDRTRLNVTVVPEKTDSGWLYHLHISRKEK